MNIHTSLKRRTTKEIFASSLAFVLVIAVAAAAIFTQFSQQAQAATLHKLYQFKDTNYAIPSEKVIWVATDGSDSNPGTEAAPMKTIGGGVKKVPSGASGYTVVVKSGIYREPHFFVDNRPNLAVQAAPHAEVWLKGSDVVASSRWQKEGNLWKVTGDFNNFCQVCTVNPDPTFEGMAAYPEQVFIDDKPLEQVASKAEVGPGKFYVHDNTPTTLVNPNNNRGGINVGAQDQITYYVGSDPTAGVTEISERPRAFTSVSEGFAWKGINIAQFAPIQEWGFDNTKYPGIEKYNGLAGAISVSINRKNSLFQDSIVAQNSTVGFALDAAESTRVIGNTFIGNGANGAGANKAHGSTFEGNTFSDNNTAGFKTKDCGGSCTVSDIKVTHIENFTFRNNIIDYSEIAGASSDPDNPPKHQAPGFWCDEGCINAKVVNNFFTNSAMAIFYEVSGSGIIASNIIESSHTGLQLASSDNVKIYNNTFSRTFLPIRFYEDGRVNSCNEYSGTSCVKYESWSQAKGLKWIISNVEMYNNIISSRAWKVNDGSRPHWAYPVRATGGIKKDGVTSSYTNNMFAGFDNNAYYRSSAANEEGLFTWDLSGGQSIDITFKSAAEIASSTQINQSIAGRDANSLDLFGTRENNPYFVKEASANTDYKKSNYNIKAGSPALGSGKQLPSDVALAIDPSGQVVKPNTAVNRGALMNALMDATNGETPTPPTTENVNVPDVKLKAAINKRLAAATGTARADDQDISKADMARLDYLSINLAQGANAADKVTDLTGLEAATNLKGLYADYNNISSLAPLAGLRKLEALTINGNGINGLAPLADIASLKVLSASENKIESIAPLKKLTNLTEVSISGQAANLDLSALEASAAGLTRFTFYGDTAKSTISNSASLKKLTNLKTLRLTGAKLSAEDLNNIGAVTSLTSLRLDRSTIADLSPLKNLTSLATLDVANQQVSTTATTETFPSPLKNKDGSTVAITDNAALANEAGGKLRVVSPIYDGAERSLEAAWATNVTIGGASSQFGGTLTAKVTIAKADLAALRAAIADAESKPDYIKNDAAVAQALTTARAVVAKPSPTPSEIQAATDALRQAIAAAEKKEADAKAAATQAVEAAENSKDPDDVATAKTKVALVQNTTDRDALTARLDAVTAAIKTARDSLSELINKASAAGVTDGMTAATAQALRDQITAARAVMNDQGASVNQLNAAKTDLQVKLDALRADKTALTAAITAAESEPDYIKNDAAVAQALTIAKNVEAQANPSVENVKKAADDLNAAVAQAKQKEVDAQQAATQAVEKAEAIKTSEEVAKAKTFVDLVKNPTVRAQLQARLDAIDTSTPTPPTPTQPVNTRQVAQQGGNMTLTTAGDKCYNLRDAATASAPQTLDNYKLRETVQFTVDCTGSAAAVGYSTQVVIKSANTYSDISKVKIYKFDSNSQQQDITNQVSLSRDGDGHLVVSYRLTDGGFGDQDGVANGVIVDPVGIYESSAAGGNSGAGGAAGGNSGSGTGAAAGSTGQTKAGGLADTGSNLVAVVFGGILLIGSGIGLVRRIKA